MRFHLIYTFASLKKSDVKMSLKSRNRKKTIPILIIIIIFIMSLFILPKHILRFFYWNFADLNDYKKFASVEMKKSENTFTFNYPDHKIQLTLPEKFKKSGTEPSFDEFLEENKTVAFLILKDDTLLYENYFDGYNDQSVIPSFSISKAFVSALVGIAIDEGTISGTDNTITHYLPEFKNPGFDKITIEDLLNMRSGIDYNEGYNSPFADMAKYYYGTDLKCYIQTLKVKEEPDQSYDYISVNPLLLSLILEKATNVKINEYLEQKIWQPIGMESDASWSIDSKKNQTIKSFCCINAVARDFARFGRLYLKKGNWQGTQIISEEWVKRSTSIINDSRDSQGYPYTYYWRVLENGAFFAKGILGQYIFVNPEKNLVFVRMGKDYADINWADLCLELSKSF
jgi:CubicO group peptidase (beta-lactamase class C family)